MSRVHRLKPIFKTHEYELDNTLEQVFTKKNLQKNDSKIIKKNYLLVQLQLRTVVGHGLFGGKNVLLFLLGYLHIFGERDVHRRGCCKIDILGNHK